MFNIPGLAELFARPLPKITFPIEREKLVHPYLKRFHLVLQKSADLGIPKNNSEAFSKKEGRTEKNKRKKERKRLLKQNGQLMGRETTNIQSENWRAKNTNKSKIQSNKKKQDKGKKVEIGKISANLVKQKKQETMSFIDDDPTLVLPERITLMKHRWPTIAKSSLPKYSHKWPVVDESMIHLSQPSSRSISSCLIYSPEKTASNGYDLVGCLLGENEINEMKTFPTVMTMSPETGSGGEGLILKDIRQKHTCKFVQECSVRLPSNERFTAKDNCVSTSIDCSPCISNRNSDQSDQNCSNSSTNGINITSLSVSSSKAISTKSCSDTRSPCTISRCAIGCETDDNTMNSFSTEGSIENATNIEAIHKNADANVMKNEVSKTKKGMYTALRCCKDSEDLLKPQPTEEALPAHKHEENAHLQINTGEDGKALLRKRRDRVGGSKVASKKRGVGLLQSLKQLKSRSSSERGKRSCRRTCATQISYKEADSSDELSICETVDEICLSPDKMEKLAIDVHSDEKGASRLHQDDKKHDPQEIDHIQRGEEQMGHKEEKQEKQRNLIEAIEFEGIHWQENCSKNYSLASYQLCDQRTVIGGMIEKKGPHSIEKENIEKTVLRTKQNDEYRSVEHDTVRLPGKKSEQVRARSVKSFELLQTGPGLVKCTEPKEQQSENTADKDNFVVQLDATTRKSTNWESGQIQNNSHDKLVGISIGAPIIAGSAVAVVGYKETSMLEEGEVLDQDPSYMVQSVNENISTSNSEVETIITSNTGNSNNYVTIGGSAQNTCRRGRKKKNNLAFFQGALNAKPQNQGKLEMKEKQEGNNLRIYRKRKMSGGTSYDFEGDNTMTDIPNTCQLPTRRVTRSLRRGLQPSGEERRTEGVNSKKKKKSSKYWEKKNAEIQREKEKREYDAKLPCVHYKTHGTCSYGNECRFSHNIDVDPKKECCKYYVAGACNKGNSCRFIHEEWPCKFFHQLKRCSNPNCRFSHADMTPYMKELFDARMKYEDQLSKQQQQEEGLQQQQQQQLAEVQSRHQYIPGTQTEVQPLEKKNTYTLPSDSLTSPIDPSILSNPECGQSQASNNDGDSGKAIAEFNFPSLYYELP